MDSKTNELLNLYQEYVITCVTELNIDSDGMGSIFNTYHDGTLLSWNTIDEGIALLKSEILKSIVSNE